MPWSSLTWPCAHVLKLALYMSGGPNVQGDAIEHLPRHCLRRPVPMAILGLEDLTVGQVSGIIAAAIFLGKLLRTRANPPTDEYSSKIGADSTSSHSFWTTQTAFSPYYSLCRLMVRNLSYIRLSCPF